jgi:hypothetical protein
MDESGLECGIYGCFVENTSTMKTPTQTTSEEVEMSASLGFKVATLLGYVALSTLLVVLLADDAAAPGQSGYTLVTLP